MIVNITNAYIPPAEAIRRLGERYRSYRMGMRLTRKEVAEASATGMTTLYKFETGKMTDISMSTLLRLLKALGLEENWQQMLPELPESPYLYRADRRKIMRIRHSKSTES